MEIASLDALAASDSCATASSDCEAAPSPPRRPSIVSRLESILGARPNRTDLIQFTDSFGWTEIGRNEKRVKACLIAKLESQRERILEFLNSRDGQQAVQDLYVKMLSAKRVREMLCPRQAIALPGRAEHDHDQIRAPREVVPETTVEFYLNRH